MKVTSDRLMGRGWSNRRDFILALTLALTLADTSDSMNTNAASSRDRMLDEVKAGAEGM